jgi:hypothetical protein
MNKLKSIAHKLLSIFRPRGISEKQKTIVKGKLLNTTIRPAIVLDNENN